MSYLQKAREWEAKRKARQEQAEVLEETIWPGNVVRVYPMRKSCLEAGHCLSLTRETDCNLFPLTWRWGWCRERVSMQPKARSP